MIRRGHRVAVLSGGGEMIPDLERDGLACRTFSIRTKNEFHPKLFFALPDILSYVRRERFDLLHAHTRVAQVLSNLVSIASGVPFLSTAHGFFKPRLGRKLIGAWGRSVIAVSPLVADELKKSHSIEESRVKLIENAVDAAELEHRVRSREKGAARESFGLPSSAHTIVSVSRLVKDKGHETLLRAFSALSREFPSAYLLVIGDGRERDNLDALRQSLDGGDRIRLASGVKDVADALAAADLFVHAPTHREGFGLSVAEAMACGRPVVATDIWALNQILRDGQTALLAKPKDEQALASALRRVLSDRALATRLSEAGKHFARERFSMERMVSQMEDVYESVAAKGEPVAVAKA